MQQKMPLVVALILYYRKTDYGEFNVANYLSDSMGFGVQYGYPLSDTQRINIGLTYDKTDIDIGTMPAREIWDFINAEGSIFETLTASNIMAKNNS